jgi:Interferon-induced transmembrane protein
MKCGNAMPGEAPVPTQPEPGPEVVQTPPEMEAAPVAPEPPVLQYAPVPQGAAQVPNYLAPAIVITVMSFLFGCCLPLGWIFGIVAISYAARANSLLAAGDHSGAATAANSAKTWCWVAVIFGVGLPVVLFILSHFLHFMPRTIPRMRNFMFPFRQGRII